MWELRVTVLVIVCYMLMLVLMENRLVAALDILLKYTILIMNISLQIFE